MYSINYGTLGFVSQGESHKKLEERERELSDSKLLIQQHEVHIKTVAESMKNLEAKKHGLEMQLDELSEEVANLKAQGEARTRARMATPENRESKKWKFSFFSGK